MKRSFFAATRLSATNEKKPPLPSLAAIIPYERQDPTLGDRGCGAAALCMVYRSLGLECTQAEVWANIARVGADGQRRASTHLLGRDARQRGLAALVLRVGHPWRVLEECLAHDIRVILNHRPALGARNGHYSVLLDLTPDQIVLHDPALGPSRWYRRDDFQQMWRKSWPWSEVTGQILVAIGNNNRPAGSQGGVASQEEISCPRCRRPILLQPSCILSGGELLERPWEKLFCPECDASLTALCPEPE